MLTYSAAICRFLEVSGFWTCVLDSGVGDVTIRVTSSRHGEGILMWIQRAAAAIFTLSLAACASPQWREENNRCSNQFLFEIPANIQTVPQTRSYPIEVPTGQVNCTTFGNQTTCTQVRRTEWVPRTEWVQIDLNAPRRQALIDACVAEACMRRMGNRECRPAR